MSLLLFGEPSPSLADRFGLRRTQLLFHFSEPVNDVTTKHGQIIIQYMGDNQPLSG